VIVDLEKAAAGISFHLSRIYEIETMPLTLLVRLVVRSDWFVRITVPSAVEASLLRIA